jgi:chaperonin cofactor prefoldin
MDEDLRKQLDWMNENLNTIAKNQAEIYMELKEIEGKIEKEAKG